MHDMWLIRMLILRPPAGSITFVAAPILSWGQLNISISNASVWIGSENSNLIVVLRLSTSSWLAQHVLFFLPVSDGITPSNKTLLCGRVHAWLTSVLSEVVEQLPFSDDPLIDYELVLVLYLIGITNV